MKSVAKILFTGDIAPLENAERKPEEEKRFFIDSSIVKLFAQYDYRVANLECVLTKSIKPIQKTGPALKSNPESVKLLTDLHIDLACLSNNHIRDYGNQGVLDTLNVCKTHSISTVGAGMNPKEAELSHIQILAGKRIAFLNFSEQEYNSVSPKRAGSNPDDFIHIIRSIRKAKVESDFQIIIMHGGKEMYPYPTPDQQELYRFIAEEGVHAIIAHHTHVIAGYEIYNKVPIFYSLGNFIFPEKNNPKEWFSGLLVGLTLSDDSVFNIELYHTLFNESEISMVKKDTISVENSLTKETITKQWDSYIHGLGVKALKQYQNLSFSNKVMIKIGIMKFKPKPNFFRMLNHSLNCKTYNEILRNLINKNT